MWEPAENLENAKEAIAAFRFHHPNRPSATDLNGPKPRRSSAHRRGGTVQGQHYRRHSRLVSVRIPTPTGQRSNFNPD